MTHRFLRHAMAATAASAIALSLAGCGGGNSETAPVQGGNAVATAAPVATITNNVAADVATGAITFTFTFDRDVGTSFTADDVNVTGAAKGAFSRTSSRSATLEVVPAAGTAGTVVVSLAAGAAIDAVGTASTAASASKAFDVAGVAPPPVNAPVVLANFDTVTPAVAVGYEGAEGSSIETGPAGGGSGRSFRVLRFNGQPYALGVIEATVPFTATRRTLSAQVHSPLAGIPMVVKIEGPGGVTTPEVPANEAVVAGWQTLTWTFSTVDPALTYNKIVLLPRLGTVDAAPGQSYYYDDIQLQEAAAAPAGALVFSTGFAAGSRTVEGGEFGGFSGSNLDGYSCNGAPENCGTGGEFVPAQPAANSYVYYYHQTPTPATDLYMGIYVQAPGVTGGLSPTTDTAGVQVSSQTTLRFKLGQNPEWFASSTNQFVVIVDLGKRYTVGADVCRLQLRRVVAPTAAAASDYAIALSSFALAKDCGGAVTSVAEALAASPISQIAFQGVGGGIALSDGTRTSGANLSVAASSGVYPTTVVLQGGITID